MIKGNNLISVKHMGNIEELSINGQSNLLSDHIIR